MIITIVTTIVGVIIAALLGLIFWFMKQKFNNLEKSDEKLENKIDRTEKHISEIDIDIGSIKTFLGFGDLAMSHSPIQLSSKGQKVLEESGIKKIVDDRKDDLLKLVREKSPTNPYDAQQNIQGIMLKFLEYYPDYTDDIKMGAFKSGIDLSAVLFVGALYLRDLIFPDLGFCIDDIKDESHK